MYELGKMVFSKAGHDKDELYIIVKKEKDCLYLSNGKNRSLDKLKKKNIKHIQQINQIIKLPATNEEIKRFISNYKREQKQRRL